ncbi:MAG: alpha/beta fold hydrolase, partial [Janthinobacterium lividum]
MAMIVTDDLAISYADHGNSADPAVLLLHGWPDDGSTWDAVVPALQKAGLRVIVPTLRGFGAT